MNVESYYENIHMAQRDMPYLDFTMKNLNYTSHFHQEIEIIYVTSGNITLNIDNNIHTINCHEVGIIMPGEIHSYSSVAQNNVYIMKIVPPIEENIRLENSVITAKDIIYNRVTEIVTDIYNESKKQLVGYKLAINKNLLDLFILILRNSNYNVISIDDNKKLSNRLMFLRSVNEFVELNYMHDINLKEIANHTNYSVYYFAHYFKEVTNVTFIEYLTSIRIEKACKLITLSDNTLTNISFACGFKNIRAFNRAFKRRLCTTPTMYRKDNN